MKGHIFNLLEQFIEETAGPDVMDEIYQACQFSSDGVFVRPGTYPDEDLAEIVTHTVDRLGLTVAQAHQAFGSWIFPHLSALVPEDMVKRDHPKEFLMDLGPIHEVELKKLWPDAVPPEFECEDTGPDTMRIRYDSPRQMFDLLEGVLGSVEEYYGVPITFERNLTDGPDGYSIADYDLTFGSPAPDAQ